MSIPRVTVIGGGPAGATAALSAKQAGASVNLYEKSHFPRHKVCGEFLSPEAAVVLDHLGSWNRLRTAGAVPLRRIMLRLGSRTLRHTLTEPGWGISRYTMDTALLTHATAAGVELQQVVGRHPSRPAVIATGRGRLGAPPQRKPERLFGFKAHFEGPTADAVELHFFNGCYAGVSPVEAGRTNVCVLAPLRMYERYGRQLEELLSSSEALRDRLAPLSRVTQCFATGPVLYGRMREDDLVEGLYPAGDAFGFVDPFTGTGMVNAIITGHLAGAAAARGDSVREFTRNANAAVAPVFLWAGLFRRILATRWAEFLAPLAPPSLLFRLTRPRAVSY